MTRSNSLLIAFILASALSSAAAKSWTDGPLNVACPDGSACPDDNTCCPADPTNSTFGCCPAPNATCCEDYVHCCPENYPVCDLAKGECTTEDGLVAVRWQVKAPSVHRPLDVPCPDGSTCPVDNTCCPADAKNSTFGCCPAPNATCCSDFRSCCPEDYPVCHVSTGVCSKSEEDLSDTVPLLTKLPSSGLPLTVSCPDGSACPDDNTCCPTDSTNSSYGCCPTPDATCCEDHEHCCPSDYPVCDLTKGECTTEDAYLLRTSMLVQYPARSFPAADSVTCPDSSTCPDDSTCCPTDASGSSYGCCPTPSATCCLDYEHCCPKDYPICDLNAGSCNAASAFPLSIPWMDKVKARL